MKFETIQPNEVVLVPRSISYGLNNKITFLIKATVSRITKTQFFVGEDAYRKSNGSLVSEDFYDNHAYLVGEKPDQTEEFLMAKSKVKVLASIIKKKDEINLRDLPQSLKCDLELLQSLESILETIKKTMES